MNNNVVNLRGHLARPEMVEAAREVLGRIERGELTGWMFIASTLNGDDITGVYGSYADRLQYAVYSASKGLNALVEKVADSPGLGYSSSEPLSGRHRSVGNQEHRLPRRLRNA